MRMILKIFALPLFIIVKVLCLIGNGMINISSYVIGLLLLVIAGCGIYCVVTANWQSLTILAVMGVGVFFVLFLAVWAVMKVDGISSSLGEFIKS